MIELTSPPPVKLAKALSCSTKIGDSSLKETLIPLLDNCVKKLIQDLTPEELIF